MAEYDFIDIVSVAPDQLDEEIKALSFGLTKYAGIVVTGPVGDKIVTVHTSSDLLAGEITELSSAVNNHTASDLAIDSAILNSVRFGKTLISKYQKILIKEGVVQAGQAGTIGKAMVDLTVMANNGNLIAADEELSNMTPIPTFFDATRIQTIRNEIRSFLGLPLV